VSEKKPFEIFSAEGEIIDREQNTELLFGRDKVYAHLATLATAAAINNIKWHITEDGTLKIDAPEESTTEETAVEVVEETHPATWRTVFGRRKRTEQSELPEFLMPSPASRKAPLPEQLTSSISVADGSYLIGSLQFANIFGETNAPTFLPSSITASLDAESGETDTGSNFRRTLMSSSVYLERPSEIFGVAPLAIGIKANHAGNNYSRYSSLAPVGYEGLDQLEVISNTGSLDELEPVLSIVRDIVPIEEGADSQYPWGIITEQKTQNKVRVQAEAHFEFHDRIGTPPEVLKLAKYNFSILAKHLKLPYSLQEKAE
jgi:hypothetical protein